MSASGRGRVAPGTHIEAPGAARALVGGLAMTLAICGEKVEVFRTVHEPSGERPSCKACRPWSTVPARQQKTVHLTDDEWNAVNKTAEMRGRAAAFAEAIAEFQAAHDMGGPPWLSFSAEAVVCRLRMMAEREGASRG